jgi:hypothetical protein
MSRESDLIQKGLLYEARERADLIDNAYRSGAIRGYTSAEIGHLTTSEIKNLYTDKLKTLGYQT